MLALAAFSSIFKLAGVLAFYPWIDQFARFIVKISGAGSESAVGRLNPTIAAAGGGIALEAAWLAILEVARGAVDATRRGLVSDSVKFDPQFEAVQQIEHFLESLSLETTDLGTIGPRLVRLVHALDHLSELQDNLTRMPPAAGDWQPPDDFKTAAQALAAWLETTKDPETAPDQAAFQTVELASKQLTTHSKTSREMLLEDIALQRIPAATARAAVETLMWADRALYHAWRLAESLRIASGNQTIATVGNNKPSSLREFQ